MDRHACFALLAGAGLLACSSDETADTASTGAQAGTGASGPGSSSAASSGTGTGGTGGSPVPACDDTPWATYGHDARRTFAANACIKGPLTTAWRYTPTPPADQQPIGGIFSAVAQKDRLFLKWKGKQGPYFGTPFVDAVAAEGATAWQWSSGVDSSFGQPLSIAFGGMLVTNDDGIWYIDGTTGMSGFNSGVDFWGQTAPVPERIYVVNTAKVDGPGVFVGAYDMAGMLLWKQNEMSGNGQFSHQDNVGSIAADGGVLFFAASYTTNAPPLTFQSGLYAFDGAAGTLMWTKPTAPAGGLSAGDGKIYGAEGAAGMAELVARNQEDGEIAWKATPEGGVGSQPPVLAAGLAIVGTSTKVVAYEAATGTLKWTADVPGAGSSSFMPPQRTTMLAALASSTLVVIAGDAHVIDLATGAIQWKGPIDQAQGAAEPIVVGSRLYVVDFGGVTAVESAP